MNAMNATLGWLLALAALIVGYMSYGGQGLVLALTVIAFWLLLQFSRTLRVMRMAAQAPVGHVANAVMFNAQLSVGLRLPQVIAITKSLGRKLADASVETWAWGDPGGDEVHVQFDASGRCRGWQLHRQTP
jgi:uncharacterized protein (DUF58 family)